MKVGNKIKKTKLVKLKTELKNEKIKNKNKKNHPQKKAIENFFLILRSMLKCLEFYFTVSVIYL